MVNLDDVVNKIFENREKMLLSKKTTVIFLIEPVSQCNLACRYCAADGWKNAGKLKIISKDILDNYLEKIADFLIRYNTRSRIIMHGYEPLQAGMETFSYVQDKVRELGIIDRVSFGVQTNGVLVNDEWADFFVKNNWDVGFSIDGPKEYHNANRVFRNGMGSYDLAMRGYKIYSEKKGKPAGIISTITAAYRKPSIQESARRYYNWLLENKIPRTILHMAAADPRNPFYNEYVMTNEEYAEWFKTLYRIWADSSDGIDIRTFQETIEAMVVGRANWGLCYLRNGCWRVISINYEGILHLCDRWSYVGKHISNYKTIDDFLFKDPELRKQALRPYIIRKYDSDCMRCEYFPICQGGCTNEAMYNSYITGRSIFGIPQWSKTQFCPAYKELFRTIEEDLVKRGIKLGFKTSA